jgi:hypothetical protein
MGDLGPSQSRGATGRLFYASKSREHTSHYRCHLVWRLRNTLAAFEPQELSQAVSAIDSGEKPFATHTRAYGVAQFPSGVGPFECNNAAAMTLVALQAQPESLRLFRPAVHHIPDTSAFANLVECGRTAAESGAIVTFGGASQFSPHGLRIYRARGCALWQCTLGSAFH